MQKHQKRRLGNTDFLQKIVLFFLIGFFIGGTFYYIFQYSFSGVCARLESNLSFWTSEDASFSLLIGKSMWQHGKYLLLYLIFSMGPLVSIYQKVFSLYTGLRNGFLLMFFLYAKGIFGLVIYLLSFFPQGLLFVPMYCYLFQGKKQNRQTHSQILRWILIVFVFVIACVMEVKVNLPIMQFGFE